MWMLCMYMQCMFIFMWIRVYVHSPILAFYLVRDKISYCPSLCSLGIWPASFWGISYRITDNVADQHCHISFYVDFEHSSWGPHVSVTSTFSTKWSLWLPLTYLIVHYHYNVFWSTLIPSPCLSYCLVFSALTDVTFIHCKIRLLFSMFLYCDKI